MIAHLKIHHPKEYNDFDTESEKSEVNLPSTSKKKKLSTTSCGNHHQLTLAQSLSKGVKWSTKSADHIKATEEITRMLCKDAMPLYTVEKNGFKRFIDYAFNKKYQLPSRKHFSEVSSEKLLTSTKEEVKLELAKVKHFSATTDLWSSISLTPYLSLTVTYIDQDWKLSNKMLETTYMPQDHTGENISNLLQQSLEVWSLNKSDMSAITTDNGSNVILAAEKLSVVRIPCFDHVLHNGINGALDNDKYVKEAITRSRKLIGSFSYSWKKKRELKKKQQELALPVRSMKVDCKTRWGSKHKMIQLLLEQEQAIRAVLSDRNHVDLIPSANQFQVCWHFFLFFAI